MQANTKSIKPGDDTRTVRAEGAELMQERKDLGFTYEDAAQATDQAVSRLARGEKAAGIRGPFTRRIERRQGSECAIGLSKATIARLEHGEPVFPSTRLIVEDAYRAARLKTAARDDSRHADHSRAAADSPSCGGVDIAAIEIKLTEAIEMLRLYVARAPSSDLAPTQGSSAQRLANGAATGRFSRDHQQIGSNKARRASGER